MQSITKLAFGLTAAFGLLGASAAAAQDTAPDCVWGILTDGQLTDLGLARVVGEGRARFQAAPKVCREGARGCYNGPYIVKGDVVVTGGRRGAWTCVLYPNKAGGADGWMPSDRLQPMPPAPAPVAAGWAGAWARGKDASITLKASGADVIVEGEATWIGAVPGAVHTGELTGRVRPRGDLITIGDDAGDYSCNARLRRLGPYLLVADNGACGGMNVSFTGVYRKAP